MNNCLTCYKMMDRLLELNALLAREVGKWDCTQAQLIWSQSMVDWLRDTSALLTGNPTGPSTTATSNESK